MVKSFNVTYVPGGATQNTVRIAQVTVVIVLITVITPLLQHLHNRYTYD